MTKPRNTIRLLHMFLFLIFLRHEVVSQSLQDKEKSVLLKLKKHWGDLPYMSNWTQSNTTANSHCFWPGITCESNSVTGLELYEINIVNDVQPFICDLNNLTVLNLSMNFVPGVFPRALYNCSKLEHLDLSNNWFVGKLPDDINRLSQLRSLVLGGNNFTGDFPAAIGGLKELRVLNLGGNLFNGTLIPEIGNLTNLEVLDLSSDNHLLPSRLPLSFGKLRKLRVFWGFSSNLIGEIPESFGEMEALEWLDVSQNGLTGKIPDGLFLLENLSIIYIYNNNLSGEIPQVVDAPNMSIIDLSDNKLTGKILDGFGNLTKMIGLSLFSNNLFGIIPEAIGRLPYLQDLNLWDNSLSGDLPPELGRDSKLRSLQVSSNRLTGQLPKHLCSRGNLVGLVAHGNSLTGELPESLENCSRLVIVKVEGNRLSGNVPKGLWTSPNLNFLFLRSNFFSGELPKKLAKNLITLDLSNNRFLRNIPTGLWTSPSLTHLMLSNNSFRGELPKEVARNLIMLDISNNKFSGKIPSGLWTSPNLTLLLMRNNYFSGELPKKLAKNLLWLDISDNRLSGKIPTESSSWRNLISIEASNNLLTGTFPQELTTLANLRNLVLDRNQLSGGLPSDIGSWKSLYTLNLSRNQLLGEVPVKLSKLPALYDLDLSHNQFSGEVPSQLGFQGLNFLNLSFNNLQGKIPYVFEIAEYSDSFLNNPGLCANNKVLKLRHCNENWNKLSTSNLALIITASSAGVLLVVTVLFCIIRHLVGPNRRCMRRQGSTSKGELISFQRLDFAQSHILSGLIDHNLIGSGGSGKVYRIPIDIQGNAVAAKRIWSDRRTDTELEKEFLAEVEKLSSIRHVNIVKLLCCISSHCSKLVVYEYMGNHSLYLWLHGWNRELVASVPSSVQDTVLDWPKRLRIAVGTAKGLCYMHHGCAMPIIHRDIKSSNILLDADFNAKIADFGLAKLLAKRGELVTLSTIAGSFGYIAPEYARTGRVNEKIDVYSFGVVLLELATGRKANHGDEHTSLAQWAWRQVEEGKPIEESLDEKVLNPQNVEEVIWLFRVGVLCTATMPSMRPTMKEVLNLLEPRARPLVNGENLGFETDSAAASSNASYHLFG